MAKTKEKRNHSFEFCHIYFLSAREYNNPLRVFSLLFSPHIRTRTRNLGFRFLQTLQKSGKDMGARSSAKSTEISRYGQKLGRKEKENEEDAAWHERKSLSLPRWRL